MDHNNDIPFIGKGWNFPPEFDKGKRTVVMTSGEEDIRQSLEILLSTKVGERLMNPDYGCNLNVMLFEPLNVTIKKYLDDLIRMAILNFEPRIHAEKITFSNGLENNVVLVEIDYIIKTTNTRTNMVYPFYLREGTNL
ncbi:MAG: GPW/gp25 family protein [Bacteroidetes bacterium]|nr:GPW/gp25 family protein [Bacteroidota bacterium]MBU1720213.1 GPW/gp25 family protein [Bacteroidota bacterium]